MLRKLNTFYLKDDYELAIARNIAVEILKNRQKKVKNKASTLDNNTTTKAKRGLDISRSFSTTRTAFPRTETNTLKAGKKAISNKVAPVQETTLTKLTPNMVSRVEGFLKELQNEGQNEGKTTDNAVIGNELKGQLIHQRRSGLLYNIQMSQSAGS